MQVLQCVVVAAGVARDGNRGTNTHCGCLHSQYTAVLRREQLIAAAASDEDDDASLHASDGDDFEFVPPDSPRTPVPARSPAGPHLELTDSERSPRRSLSFSPDAITSPAFSPD